MALAEAIVYCLFHNVDFPDSTAKFSLAATRMLVRHITAAAGSGSSPFDLALAAMRTMEIAVRFGVTPEELQGFYQDTVKPFEDIFLSGNPILCGLSEWLHQLTDKVDKPKGLISVLISGSGNFDQVVDAVNNEIGMVGGHSGVVLINTKIGVITCISTEDVTRESEISTVPPRMIEVLTFTSAYRQLSELTCTPHQFKAVHHADVEAFLSNHFPSAVTNALVLAAEKLSGL